jgi:hypothetical protein
MKRFSQFRVFTVPMKSARSLGETVFGLLAFYCSAPARKPRARNLLSHLGFGVLFGVLAAQSVQAEQLTIHWDDNSYDEEGFVIERTRDGNTFVEVGRVPANFTQFTDPTVNPVTAYWYRITAYSAVGRSASSNVAGAVTPLNPQTPAEVHWQQTGIAKSKLTNLSARTIPGTGDRSLIVGFVVKDASKSVLLRAVGPGIAAYMTAATLQDPNLIVRDGGSSLLENDDWGGTEPLKSASSRVGAFPLVDSSRDAVLLSDFSPRGYTVAVNGSGSGYAMAEIYDADVTPTSPGRLVNLSVRAQTGNGDDVLIVGFVIAGSTPMRVLVRGGGPVLANLGVATALADPQLDLYRGREKWDRNDDWRGDASIDVASVEAGAFRWTNPASYDAALVVTLPPGSYTAIVSGVSNTTGVALAEVYELPW